jgi:hypothetical protein
MLSLIDFVVNKYEIYSLKNKKSINLNSKSKKNLKYIAYDFTLYRKYRKKIYRIIDDIIYVLVLVLTLLINLIVCIILYISNKSKKIYNKFLIKIKDKTAINLFIRKNFNAAIIVSWVWVYIIITINENKFSNIVVNIYTFLATVIIIPFIYDGIKSGKYNDHKILN